MKKGKKIFLLITTLFVFSFVIFKGINIQAGTTHEVDFDINYLGGVNPVSQTVDSGNLAVIPEVAPRVGYNLLGWYLEDTLYDFSNPVTANLSLTAKWEVINYNITYILYEDEPNDAISFTPVNLTYNVESNFSLEVPEDRLSSFFRGWYTDNSFTGDPVTDLAGELTGDLTLYAKWEKRVHTVTFIVNDEFYHEVKVVHSELITDFPVDPEKTDFDFVGWRDEFDVHINEFTPINRSMVLKAYFAETVTVKFIDELAGDFERYVIKGEKLVKPEDPIKPGYNFLGWYLGDDLYDFSTVLFEGVTLTAKWDMLTFGITYILYEDEPNDAISFTPVNLTYDPTSNFVLEIPEDRLSATFVGWYTNKEFTGDMVTSLAAGLVGDLTLYAKWETRIHTVTFMYNNQVYYEVKVSHSDLIPNFPLDPVKEGFEFLDWRDEADININEFTPINKSMVLNAVFLEEITVKFIDDVCGDFEVSIIVGQKVTQPTDPEKLGYEFLGWFLDGILFDFSTRLYENTTLIAKWNNLIEAAKIEVEKQLKEYIKNVEEPNDYLLDIINTIVNSIDDTNFNDLALIVASGKLELLTAEKDYVKDLMADYISKLDVSTDRINQILANHKALVDEEPSIDNLKALYDDLVAAVAAELALMAAKESAKNDLLALVGPTYSDKVEALLNQAFTKINDSNTLLEVADLLAEYTEKIETQLKIEKAQKDLNEALTDYISSVAEPKGHLSNILENYSNYINKDNYLEVANIINQAKLELLAAEKTYVNDILSQYEADASPKVLAIINTYKALINNENDINKIKDLLEEAILKVTEQIQIDETFDTLTDKYNEFITTDRHYYDQAGLDEIDAIYNAAKALYDDNLITLEELNQALANLDKVVVRYTNNLIRVDDSIRPEAGKAMGYASSKAGFAKGTELVVEVKDLTDQELEAIKNLINSEKVVDKNGNKSAKELAEELQDLLTYGKLDIYLIDADGNRLTNVSIDEYEINLILPEDLLENDSIKMLFLTESLLEVFEVTLEGEWLAFTTDHMSNFFLIGEGEEILYLWWVIIVELVVIMVVLGLIIVKFKENRKPKVAKANALALPILATVIPTGTLITIIVLLVVIVLEFAYLIYLFLTTSKDVKEVVVEKEVIVEKPVEVIKEVIVEKLVPVVAEPVVEPVTEVRTIYNYSFKSRLHLADADTENRYNDLKNHLLSYAGVTSNMSWKQETFTVKGKMVVKLRLQGKTMRVYLGIDPKTLVDTKYKVQDVSGTKTHETTPSLLIVKGPGILRHAMELIDQWMAEHEVSKDENYKVKNYKERNLKLLKLIELGLVKVQEAEFIENK